MRHPWDRRLGFWWIAEDHPDRPAVVDCPSGLTPTYGELAARAHQIVHALRSRGLGPGDVIAYALPNDVDVLWWQLAMQEAGIRSIALNPSLSGAEIRTILDHSVAGTTGEPKAIARPIPPGDPSVIADQMKLFGRAFRFRPLEGVHLVSAGMHHGGCQSFYQGALNVGQALAIMGRFDAERTLQLIDRHRVTTAYMVPTQFVRLLRLAGEVRDRYDTSSLEVVVHSAAPCPVEVKRRMMDWWGPVIWETYGGMEGAAAIAKPHRWLEKPGTVGPPSTG